MNSIYIPEGYKPALNKYDHQRAIDYVRTTFQLELADALNLKRVTAPLFVTAESGVNDNLNGVERPVSFDVPAVQSDAEVVHSLAKWKRLALKNYNFEVGDGLYTNMNAIRRDEELDNIHSVYVDQWDWEKVITEKNRNIDFLKLIVKQIVRAICNTNDRLHVNFPQLETSISSDVTFITTQELEDMYPDLTPKERENAFLKDHPTTAILKIGGALKSGAPHDGRAPDYDDWELNCDIFFWDEVLDRALEISSMGIRVNKESLLKQLEICGCMERCELPFHKMLLNDELPLSIGGGIGQSRLCMLLLGCAHIGEVQSSIWDSETIRACREAGVCLL